MTASVRFQPTPNPNAGKFVLDRSPVPPGASRSIHSREDADDDLARALMDLEGVRSLFMVGDFITVSKTPAASWDALAPRVRETIEAHL